MTADEIVSLTHATTAIQWADRHITQLPDCCELNADGVPPADTAGTPSWSLGEARGHLLAALIALGEYERRKGGG